MKLTVAQKILASHLESGNLIPGEEIAIRIDQTLTQDATGTLVYLEFERIGLSRIKAPLSVSYVDHNTLQTSFENADDHAFLQSAASKFGVRFSRPGNGICHQVHLERFGAPGATLIGSDSHTPTAGGLGALGIGAGGLDVAAAMAGYPFMLACPEIVHVWLDGSLPPWCSAKDVILEVLRRLDVEGGVGKVMEYGGPGVASLNVPQRATITNMGAELGATSSVFPSDSQTRAWLRAQGREDSWKAIKADSGAKYHAEVRINLSELEPLAACPHSPGKVRPVRELEGTPLVQVCVGSCTNSSLQDMVTLAAILKGRRIHPRVSLTVSPGSRQVFKAIAANGALADMVAAGARIVEVACGPCIGMGQAPSSGGATLRTFNRNFKGRSGTADAQCYLSGVETAAASAVAGAICDPRSLGESPVIRIPKKFEIDDSMILEPADDPASVEIIKGPNIKSLPDFDALPDCLRGKVLLRVEDNITTDDILPGGAKVLPLRSNIPAISKFAFSGIDPTFAVRAQQAGTGFVIARNNYGQGSSREHAALAPRHLGLRAVIAASFARIHRSNLINFGILPLLFRDAGPCAEFDKEDELEISGIHAGLAQGGAIALKNLTKGNEYVLRHDLSAREAEMVKAGGLLNLIRDKARQPA
ncbi:MAG TPA: aconitate hydratase [Candidatus Brocadiia bacterium]|nr:aconitate hydratase [Candidatus Brocadiia bacterium]